MILKKSTRGAILCGWKVPEEGLWRFPLVKDAAKICNLNTDTAILNKHPHEVLQDLPPPLPDQVYNVYEVKTKPEFIRYCHVAAGFPTKPTWLTAIRNGHYKSWPGLTAEDAAKYYPESTKMWKGHGRKIKAGLRSTKQLVDIEPKEAQII